MPPKITKEMIEARAAAVRVGGKGTVRRTTKVHRKDNSAKEDKNVQATLKKLGVTPVSEIDEAFFIKTDGSGMVFKQPKVQASMQSQCFVVSGNYENKTMQEMLPQLLGTVQAQLAAAQKAKAAQ